MAIHGMLVACPQTPSVGRLDGRYWRRLGNGGGTWAWRIQLLRSGEAQLCVLSLQPDLCIGRLAEFVTKAKTVQKSGDEIEKLANNMKSDMDKRLAEVLQMLRSGEGGAKHPLAGASG